MYAGGAIAIYYFYKQLRDQWRVGALNPEQIQLTKDFYTLILQKTPKTFRIQQLYTDAFSGNSSVLRVCVSGRRYEFVLFRAWRVGVCSGVFTPNFFFSIRFSTIKLKGFLD